MSMRKTRRIRGFLALAVLALFVFVGTGLARDLREIPLPADGTDARPPLVWGLHNLSNLWCAFLNIGRSGDPNAVYPSMEWPGGSGSYYIYSGDFWGACAGAITSSYPDSMGKWASCSDFSAIELWASDGYPMEKLVPGPTALEETRYGFDDWNSVRNADPFGMLVQEENYSWGTPGFNNFIATKFVVSSAGAPYGSGAPLDGFIMGLRADCDLASADPFEAALEDMVYYDGHAIWLNGDPDVADFEYIFQDGTTASEQDIYTYRQNLDSPLAADDPNNIFYYYNYADPLKDGGPDGIMDNDVNGDGVSDHYTILFKVSAASGDTLYPLNSGTGMPMFTAGNRPANFWQHVVGDTTYAVVPRNMSYMWDSDGAGSSIDDSGEQDLAYPVVGFLGWRLIDAWLVKADGTIERPMDVDSIAIPLSHAWWNWESDPGTDAEKYDYMWGQFPDESGQYSGPAYIDNWIGNPNTPDARTSVNPGPWPFVYDNPLALGYPTFDYRFLPSIGPVSLNQGDSLVVIGGWVIGAGLEGVRESADQLLSAYYLDGAGGWGVPSLPPTPILFYEGQDNAVHLEWGANAESYSPFGGYRVYRSDFITGDYQFIAEITEPGVREYTDNTARNGFPYFYVVTAFDAETGVESTKSNYKQTIEGSPLPVTPNWGTDSNWTENVRVVPNPYKISAAWEQTYFNKIAFINLPPMCDIHIFTLAGDHVITLEHRDYTGENGTEYWDLVSRNDQDVVTGLYVYRVETADDFVIDKFAIIK
jgi:hypothetical protein